MLAQKIFAVVVSIRRADDAVNVLLRRLLGIVGESAQIGGTLVIEFDEMTGLWMR